MNYILSNIDWDLRFSTCQLMKCLMI
ncbi:Protein CBG27593 [Caenorhabditis briggsae]|uniref:Protein CBG27593 n=1 Tax=Caenorhabditis briggsae TaxID=6238 RepID=B6IKG3_CAEBR|nr:Protein CBG27593 [Caenorhabditis briggsae]CAS00393.1 Protein CBG27593 [Caenorhabditis briggsae]